MSTRSPKRAAETISVPYEDLSDRALLLRLHHRVDGIYTLMADLNQDVADLGAAVAGVTTRLADLLNQSQQKVTDLLTQVGALQADDDTDKAAIAAGLQEVADLQSQAADASTQIESSIANLNALAQPEQPPVDPAA